MLVGRSPFRADSPLGVLRRIADDAPRPIREVNAQVPEWMVAMVHSLHEKRPEDRADSSLLVAEELRACLSHWHDPLLHALPISIAKRLQKSSASHWIPWTVCAMASAVAIACIFIFPDAVNPFQSFQQKPSEQHTVPLRPNGLDLTAPSISHITSEISEMDLANTFLQFDTELRMIEIQVRKLELSVLEQSPSDFRISPNEP
jgi:hypothetical protein